MSAERVRLTEEDILKRLRGFEAEYGMSSEEFIEKYTTGKLEGTGDFVRWMGLCRMRAATPERQSRSAST